MDNKEIVKTLAQARGLLEKHTPEGMLVEINTHSTATHCHIYLVIEGEPNLLIWYKTNWVSSQYEFNERYKTIGLQKGCSFADPMLKKFFDDVANAVHEANLSRERKARLEEEEEKRENESLIDKYRQKFAL